MSKQERVLPNVVSILILGTLIVSFFMDDNAYIGACIVAIPTLAYVQYVRWVSQRDAAGSD